MTAHSPRAPRAPPPPAASHATTAATTAAAAAAAAASHEHLPLHTVSHLHTPRTVLTSHLQNAPSHAQPASLYAADLSRIAAQHALFTHALPNITPFYAVKCNSDPLLIAFFARLGLSFDCASLPELQLASRALRAASPVCQPTERIVFANPFKQARDLTAAVALGVRLMTFDSADELPKIAAHAPHAHLLLRVAVPDAAALCPLSSKFGARHAELPRVLDTLRVHGLHLAGVAFHVGSGCTDAASYARALARAADVFAAVEAAGLPPPRLLDVGGGFPGRDGEAPVTFRQIAAVLRAEIPRLFGPHVRVIAEPGRYYVTTAYTLASQVVMTREREGRRGYYLADGVYSSFRDALILGVSYPAKVLQRRGVSSEDSDVCDLYGPSRTEVDVVARDVVLPKLATGDWLYFENMGAYTMSLATKHAGPPTRTIYYFRLED